jgi:hypothetical protein
MRFPSRYQAGGARRELWNEAINQQSPRLTMVKLTRNSTVTGLSSIVFSNFHIPEMMTASSESTETEAAPKAVALAPRLGGRAKALTKYS